MSVEEFYLEKTVLVTGATGYVGSVLLERLLGSCPGVRRVLVLVRRRAGRTPRQRARQLLDKQVFSRLAAEAKQKVDVVEGDISQPGLGLSAEDYRRLQREVQVIFHAAASISFGASLGRALSVNLAATAALLELARGTPQLEAFVHVSTAFANCFSKCTILEKVYSNEWDPRELMKTVQSMTTEEIAQNEKEMLGEHPTTYSFTKQLCEKLIASEGADLPVAIVRPSMVLCTAERPFPGWLENVNTGTFGFLAGAGRGVFRTIRVNPAAPGDWVPADYFAAFLVVVASRTARTRGLEVYHYTCGLDRRQLWSEFVAKAMASVRKYPTANAVFYPRAAPRHGALRNWLVVLLFHYLPALLIDTFGSVTETPAKLLAIQKKYARGSSLAAHFTSTDWRFCNRKVRELWATLGDADKERFRFSLDDFDWDRYIETCVLGVREFYHRQGPDSLPAARLRQQCLKGIFVLFWIFLLYIVFSVVSYFFLSPFVSLFISSIIVLFLYYI